MLRTQDDEHLLKEIADSVDIYVLIKHLSDNNMIVLVDNNDSYSLTEAEEEEEEEEEMKCTSSLKPQESVVVVQTR